MVSTAALSVCCRPRSRVRGCADASAARTSRRVLTGRISCTLPTPLRSAFSSKPLLRQSSPVNSLVRRSDQRRPCLAQNGGCSFFALHCLCTTLLTGVLSQVRVCDGISEHGRRHLRSSSYRTLAVPRTCTTHGDRSFAVAGPHVWNSLPAAIRQITSYGQFRQHLTTHYSGPRNLSTL